MYADERKVIVRKELQGAEIAFDSLLCCIWIILESTESLFNLAILYVSNIFIQKAFHSITIQTLQAVLQAVVVIVGRTFPVEIQIVRIAGFIHDFCKEEVHQLVKSIFISSNIVLAQNQCKLIILLLNGIVVNRL